jgi:hypothetical protein
MGLGRKFKKAVKSLGNKWDHAVHNLTDSDTYSNPINNAGDSFSPSPDSPDLAVEDVQPTVMPLPDDELVKAQRRKSLVAQRRRSGRQSTIYSGDTLG